MKAPFRCLSLFCFSAEMSDSRCSSPHPAGPPPRPCREITAATLALFWTSPPSRWQRWIQRCLLFLLAIASGTCCWGTRRFRTMTGSMKREKVKKHTLSLCSTVCEKLPTGDFICVCVHTSSCSKPRRTLETVFAAAYDIPHLPGFAVFCWIYRSFPEATCYVSAVVTVFPTFPRMTSHDNPPEMRRDLYSAVGFMCRCTQQWK